MQKFRHNNINDWNLPLLICCFLFSVDKTEYFQINSIDGSGEIVTCKELDYEKKKVFSFNLETYDCNHTVFNICGNVVKTEIHNKLSITVNLTDTNDNPPRFIHKFTRIAIQSDTKMNEIIENLTVRICLAFIQF